MTRRVIVLEDDESLRLVITKALSRAGFDVRATASPDTAISRMARREADALVADVLLGQENFLTRLHEVKQLRPDAPVIVMSAQTTVATALKADSAGAYEYLPKPFDINDLTKLLETALRGPAFNRTSAQPAESVSLIGQSSVMQATFKAIGRLSKSRVPVLITGPDGSGRATVARLVHHQAGVGKPLIEVGPQHFTTDPGRYWDQAQGGTLLLRRAEAWSLDAQGFVREALEIENPVGPRIIVTASDAVAERVPTALLDLISVGRIEVPPLFRRGNDRAMLFAAFLKAEDRTFELTAEGAEFVNSQAWPGEVLQLKRAAKHIVVQGNPREVGEQAIADAMRGPGSRDSDEELELAAVRYFAASDLEEQDGLAARAQARLERGLIRAALEASGGIRLEAARRLGMNRNTFARKLDQLDLEDGD